jgi:hypothetical protein
MCEPAASSDMPPKHSTDKFTRELFFLSRRGDLKLLVPVLPLSTLVPSPTFEQCEINDPCEQCNKTQCVRQYSTRRALGRYVFLFRWCVACKGVSSSIGGVK